MALNNCIFEELLKAAHPKRGLFVIPLPTGSGKTYNSCLLMAEELKKEDARRIFYVTDAKKQLDATVEDIKKKHVMLAPTGIAAINAGGSTLHSFFKLPFYPLLPNDSKYSVRNLRNTLKYNSEKIKLLREVELIIIDEISMVRADIIDFIDKVLRVYNRNMSEPFGGKQLLFADLVRRPVHVLGVIQLHDRPDGAAIFASLLETAVPLLVPDRDDSEQLFAAVVEDDVIGVARVNIDGNVNLFAQRVGVFYRRGKFFASEIIGERAQGKIFAADVRRVRAEVESRGKPRRLKNHKKLLIIIIALFRPVFAAVRVPDWSSFRIHRREEYILPSAL